MWPQETTQASQGLIRAACAPTGSAEMGGRALDTARGLRSPSRRQVRFRASALATVRRQMGLFPCPELGGISPGTSLPTGCPAREQLGHLLAPSFRAQGHFP